MTRSDMSEDTSEDFLAAALVDGAPVWPPAERWPGLLDAARDHGILPLLSVRAATTRFSNGPVEQLRAIAARDAALALARERELRRVLDGLHAAGVPALILKGAHLAWSVYPSPGLRPRLDTDLLIRESDRTAARACLLALGYAPLAHVTGTVAFGQFHFTRTDSAGVSHALDVHWRVANPRAFEACLTWSDLAAARQPVPTLGPHAFGPSRVHALLIGAIHRAAHHRNSDRLIWLYDVHLLASALTSAEWSSLVHQSVGRGVAPFVAGALTATSRRLRTRLPEDVLDQLVAACWDLDRDVAAFAAGTLSPLGVVRSDFRRVRGWGPRAAFLREHLLPPPSYMARKYGVASRAALPFLYLHRAVSGYSRWVRHK